jgi:Fe2+ transport system protein FeoA
MTGCTMCGSTAGCAGCPIASGFYLPVTLDTVRPGARAVVQRLATERGGDLRRLLALGILPGVELEVERAWPAMVLRIGYATVALDAQLAAGVVVQSRQ